jgi:hypothetical protein
MNLIEKIVGIFPTVSDKAKAARDFITAPRAKVFFIVALAIAALSFAHHRGVVSQKPKIASLTQRLDTALADHRKASAPKPSWLPEQAAVNGAIKKPAKPPLRRPILQFKKSDIRHSASTPPPTQNGATLCLLTIPWVL